MLQDQVVSAGYLLQELACARWLFQHGVWIVLSPEKANNSGKFWQAECGEWWREQKQLFLGKEADFGYKKWIYYKKSVTAWNAHIRRIH